MTYLSNEKDVAVRCLHGLREDLNFRFFNPSVTVAGGRIVVSLRASNFERSDVTGKFYILRPNTEVRNENFICEFDGNFNCQSQSFLENREPQSGTPYAPSGFEDIRILTSPAGTVAGMACLPAARHEILADNELAFDTVNFSTQMGRVEFNPALEVAKFTRYPSPLGRKKERNWSPFYIEGRLCVVYQWNPLILMELGDDGSTRFIKWFDAAPPLKGMRGGSPGIPTANGFLFVVHRRFGLSDKLRFSHQFLELDHHLRPRRISEEFTFLSTGIIEYCAGLTEVDGRYLITFGLNDALPFIAQVDPALVERMLVPFAAPFVENAALLNATLEEQRAAADGDFPGEIRLSPLRLATVRAKEWLQKITGKGRE